MTDRAALSAKWQARSDEALQHPHAQHDSPFYDPAMRIEGLVLKGCADELDALPSVPDLRAWAQHHYDCEVQNTHKDPATCCSCGLDAALSGGSK